MWKKTVWFLSFLPAVAALSVPAAAQQTPVEPVIVPSPPSSLPVGLPPGRLQPQPQHQHQTRLQPPPARPQPPVVLPQGTKLSIRFNKDVRLESPGSTFQAALSDELRVGGEMIAPRGTLVRGELISSYNGPALNLTQIWLKNDWRPLYAEPFPIEARRGSGNGRKVLAGLALASVIAGEALSQSRTSGWPPRRKHVAAATALRTAGSVGALLLARGAISSQWQPVKLKRGRQMSFQLLEDLAFSEH